MSKLNENSITRNDATAALNFPSSDTVTLETASTERLRVDSSGVATFAGDVSIADKIVHTGDTNTAIRFPAADTITAETFGSERLRIDSSGKVGIGCTDPDNALTVSNGSGDRIHLRPFGAGSGGCIWSTNGAQDDYEPFGIYAEYITFATRSSTFTGTERMRLTSDGALNVFSASTSILARHEAVSGGTYYNYVGYYSATDTNSGTASYGVFTDGSVDGAANSYGGWSDVKLKENIVDAKSQWDDIKNLRVRNFNLKEGITKTQIGLIAQEAETVSPGLVFDTPDRDEDGEDLGTTTKSLRYSVLYMKAVKALQEAMAKIETLETKVAALEAA